MTKQQELIKELESLSGKIRTPKHRRRSEEILIELKLIKQNDPTTTTKPTRTRPSQSEVPEQSLSGGYGS